MTGSALAPSSRTVVAFDGPSGAGKSTLAQRLYGALRPRETSLVLAMDDLYPGWDGLEAGVDALAEHVLRPYSRGAVTLSVPTWDWKGSRPGPIRYVPAPALLIVEGVGCGARRCSQWLDLLIWVDAPESLRRERALARDGQTYVPYWDRWAALEREHFGRESTHGRAAATLGLL